MGQQQRGRGGQKSQQELKGHHQERKYGGGQAWGGYTAIYSMRGGDGHQKQTHVGGVPH